MVPSSRGSHDKLDKVPIDAIRGEMEASSQKSADNRSLLPIK